MLVWFVYIGQQQYSQGVITKTLLMRQDAIVMVYDISKPETFEKLENWYETIKELIDPDDVAIIIVGCKSDLSNNVLHENAKEYAKKIRGTY